VLLLLSVPAFHLLPGGNGPASTKEGDGHRISLTGAPKQLISAFKALGTLKVDGCGLRGRLRLCSVFVLWRARARLIRGCWCGPVVRN
jgi:hypothetical protein